MADLPERREPTHTLTVEVPLYLHDLDAARFDPVQDAMRVVLALSRAAAEGFVCDDVQVTLIEEAREEVEPGLAASTPADDAARLKALADAEPRP